MLFVFFSKYRIYALAERENQGVRRMRVTTPNDLRGVMKTGPASLTEA